MNFLIQDTESEGILKLMMMTMYLTTCFTFLHSYCRATQNAWIREVGPTGKCFGYRLCGDNIDKIVKTHYMRLDKQNVLLHYLHYQYLISFVTLIFCNRCGPYFSSFWITFDGQCLSLIMNKTHACLVLILN